MPPRTPRPPSGGCSCAERVNASQQLALAGRVEAALRLAEAAHTTATACPRATCRGAALCNVGLLQMHAGGYDEAASAFLDAAAALEGTTHPDYVRSLINGGAALAAVGRLREAESHLRAAAANKLGDAADAAAHNLAAVVRLRTCRAAEGELAAPMRPDRVIEAFFTFELTAGPPAQDPEMPPPAQLPSSRPAAVAGSSVSSVGLPVALICDAETEAVPSASRKARAADGNGEGEGIAAGGRPCSNGDWVDAKFVGHLLRELAHLHSRGRTLAGALTQGVTRGHDGSMRIDHRRCQLEGNSPGPHQEPFRADVRALVTVMKRRAQHWAGAIDLLGNVQRLAATAPDVLLRAAGDGVPPPSGAQAISQDTVDFSVEDHVALLGTVVAAARGADSGVGEATHVTVSRGGCLEELSFFFATLRANPGDFLRPLRVTFAGETAVDGGAGGVCNELFTVAAARGCALLLQGELSPPLAEGLGALLLKCCVEARPVGVRLPRAFYEFICGREVSTGSLWAAVAQLDAELYRGLALALIDETVDAADLHCEGEAAYRETSTSRLDAVNNKLREVVIGRRRVALEHVARGFDFFAATLPPLAHAKLLRSPAVVRAAFEGSADLTAREVVASLEFRGWNAKDSTPFHLCCWLHSSTARRRRLFLRLCTGSDALPVGGLSKRIVVFRSPERFASQTCFSQLNLPPFESAEALNECLEAVTTSIDVSPQMHEVAE